MFSVGAAMAVGGVVQMLSPQVSGLRMRQDPDNKPSYAFGGPLILQHPATPFLCFMGRGK
jgi:predicted phage tail protein